MAEGNPFSGLFDDEKKADNPFVGLFDTKTLSEEDADLENFSYEQFQQSPKLRRAAVRFAKAHLGYDNPSAEKAINETIEHFREFNVNELTAAGDAKVKVAAFPAASKMDPLFSAKAVVSL